MENGTVPGTDTNGISTPEEFHAMTDASEKPKVTAPKNGRQPRTTAPSLSAAAAAAAAAPPTIPAIPPEQVQAARNEIYVRSNVPEPLRPIFNRLPPEEIVFVIAHVEHAYRSGFAAAGAVPGAGGEDPIVAYERGKTDAMQQMAKYPEAISGLLKALSLLDSDPPNVQGCRRLADRAYAQLTTP